MANEMWRIVCRTGRRQRFVGFYNLAVELKLEFELVNFAASLMKPEYISSVVHKQLYAKWVHAMKFSHMSQALL